MRKRFFRIVVSLALVMCLGLTQVSAAAGQDNDVEYLKKVIDLIKTKYNGQVTDKQLIEGALKGMFDTMDPYTVYFTPEEADKFLVGAEGKYTGIGVMITKEDKYVVVTKVFPASPAEKAGLSVGDKIVSVDGKSVIGVSTEEVSTLAMGEEGTKVVLGIVKNGENQLKNIELERAEIKVNPITYEVRGDIGYLKIDTFNSNTEPNVLRALYEFDIKGIKKMVLDLRDNPGGQLDQVVSVAKKLVPEGPIVKVDYKSELHPDAQYLSELKNPKYKIAVLVNGSSASASEVLAGAIQDTKVGSLIGTKTYGKAKVQELVPMITPEAFEKYKAKYKVDSIEAYELIYKYKVMPKNDEIMGWTKITTGQYTTPAGRMIDEKGLEPDYTVEAPSDINGINLGNIQKLTKTTKPTLDDEGHDVYNAEKILMALGYDVDKPDTIMDLKTYFAVSRFQEDNGFYPYGTIDFETQQALNEKLGALIMENDKQYAKALEILNK